MVIYAKWSLKRVKLQEVFYEKKSRHVYFFREIVLHATAVFLGYNIHVHVHVHVHVCKSKLFLNPFTARVLDGVFKVTLTFKSVDKIL